MQTIRTAEPSELLSLIPYQLGFAPDRSAVVVSLRGPRARVGLVARVDLADLADERSGAQVARTLVSHLVADGAARTVLAVYTDDTTWPVGPDRPEVRAWSALTNAGEHFLGAPECWVVSPTGYFCLHCTDPGCCPPGGRPLSDLKSTRVGAQMVLAGATIAGSRDDLGAVAPASADARRSARRAASRFARHGQRAAPGTELARWRSDGLAVWRGELDRTMRCVCDEAGDPDEESSARWLETTTTAGPVAGSGAASDDGPTRRPLRPWQPTTSVVAGRLQAALEDVLVRDAVLVSFVEGTDPVGDRVVAGDAGEEVGQALGRIVDPAHGTPPPEPRTEAARAVLEQVVAHTARRAQAPALTLLSVLAWWQGDGARAGALVERALKSDPVYRLAVLVQDTLDAGMPPGWVARRGAGDSGGTTAGRGVRTGEPVGGGR